MLKTKTVQLILDNFLNNLQPTVVSDKNENTLPYHNKIINFDDSTLYETFVDLGFLKNNICLFSEGLIDAWPATKEWIKFRNGKLSLDSICKDKGESLVPVVYTK